MARPSDYTQEMALEICARIAAGRSLRSIATDEDMPAEGTIYSWLYKHEEFQEKYAHAREAQSDVYAEEIISIADECEPDSQKVALARLRTDNRKWVASKLKPKKYGDKLDLNHTGKLETIPDDKLDNRINELIGKAGIGTITRREISAQTSESDS